MATFARAFSAIGLLSSLFLKSVLLILISVFVAHSSALSQQSRPLVEFSDSATHVKGDKADFDSTPEPDHPALMRLYMAANSDIINTPAFAREHFMVFQLPPDQTRSLSRECSEAALKVENEFERKRLMLESQTKARKALEQAKKWPKTKVFRLRHRAILGPYDASYGGFPIDNRNNWILGGDVEIARRLGDVHNAYRRTDGQTRTYCAFNPGNAYQLIRKHGRPILAGWQTAPHRFALRIAPEPKLRRLPMEPAQAKALVARFGTGPREIDIDILVNAGPAAFGPMGGKTSRTFPVLARAIAARAIDKETARVLHLFDFSASMPQSRVEPAAELHAETAARVAAPAYAATESKQQEPGRHQPAHIEPGRFEDAPDVNYRDLLRLYMSANADTLNTDAFAIEHMLRFHNASITDRECDALNLPEKDEFTRSDFIRSARAKLKIALGQAQSNLRKGKFRIRAPISLGEYDHGSQAFDIRSTSRMPALGSAPKTVKINRNRVARRFGGYGAAPDDKCVLLKSKFHNLKGHQVVPFAMELALPGVPALAALPMDPAAAGALLARYRRGVQYRPKAIMELLIAVGPIVVGHGKTRRINETTSIETSLLAARVLDEKGEKVLHTYDLFRPRRTPTANLPVAPRISGARQVAQRRAPAPAPAAPIVSGAEPAVPFRQHLAGLLLIRENPDLISDQTLL